METTPADPTRDLVLEIAHILLIDVVDYSTLLVNEQIELVQELNQIVRNTEQFRLAEASGKLVRLPTGDGMALLFFRSPEEPAQCALEISQAVQSHPRIRLRMGVHSGPVNEVTDVNDRTNIAGAGINVAQRVMDCGDAGHILLSKHLADDLAEYRHWRPHLHDLGECEVKHGLRLHIVNLYKDKLGNPQLPQKLRRRKRWKPETGAPVRPVREPRWPKAALIAALLLSVGALTVSFLIFFHRGATQSAAPMQITSAISEKSIAVLPFENLSDEKQNAYFTDGIQDEILTDLAKLADLKVISRTSVMQYRGGAARNLREIASALGVAHVIEGTVQRAEGVVRVSVQLIDARTDAHLWGEHYDRQIADVFAMQSEIAEQIVSQLKVKFSPEEKAAIEERPTADLAAYDLYARAKALAATPIFSVGSAESILFTAVQLLDQAVARDPKFLLAYCQLARAHDQIYLFGIDHTPARLALAEAAVQAVLRLRPAAGEAHLASAYHLYCGLDYERAQEEVAIALRALPNEPFAFELNAYIERRQGRWDDSTRNLQRALELDPRNFLTLQQIFQSYKSLRRFAEAAAILDRALALLPDDAGTLVQRAGVDLEWRADPKPLHARIESIVADPKAAKDFAPYWLYLALCERDAEAAARALTAMSKEGYQEEGVPFPYAWCEGLAARARGDIPAAQAAFRIARSEIEKSVREQPAYAQALCVLGMIDAGLERKEEAIREGERAVELLPITKDSINGALLMEYLAVIYTWTGEKDRAIEQLAKVAQIPGDVSYGQVRLHPFWDPLRGDPRFEKIVASLAPR